MTERCLVEHTPPTLSVCVLASGSKGNVTYVSDGRTSVLIDAGLSGVEIERRLTQVDLAAQRLDALIVTHEHNDHIRGVGVLARRYRLPVYISARTARAASSQLGRIDDMRYFDTGCSFAINGLAVHPFSTSHDASDPAGFTIASGGLRMGIATDLGVATAMVKHHLRQCNLLILEANHDPTMLIEGPYTWPLKQRIKSRDGHLSNEESRKLLAELNHDGLCHVILAHLSETNNTPQKALRAAQQALQNSRTAPRLHLASQDHGTALLTLK